MLVSIFAMHKENCYKITSLFTKIKLKQKTITIIFFLKKLNVSEREHLQIIDYVWQG